MTLNRWKVLACTLTIGIGGLAVFATPPAGDKTEPAKEPAPLPNLTVKPTSPPTGSDTPAPDTPDIDIPVVPLVPPKAETPAAKPANLPVFEPITPPVMPVVPAKAEEPAKTDDKKPDTDKVPDVVVPELKAIAPELPKPVVPTPDISKPDLIKVPRLDEPAPPVGLNPPSAPVAPPMRPAPMPVVPLPDPVAPAHATDTIKVPLVPGGSSKSTDAATRLKLLLRMGDGQPRFEIRNAGTTELLLKVYGERVEMQAPPDAKSSLAGVTATGRVRFTAPGIEGTCDHLTILSGTGEVLLKGNIHMKTKRGKAWSEMTAEKMVYQIGTSGMSAGTPRNPVTPASYIPD